MPRGMQRESDDRDPWPRQIGLGAPPVQKHPRSSGRLSRGRSTSSAYRRRQRGRAPASGARGRRRQQLEEFMSPSTAAAVAASEASSTAPPEAEEWEMVGSPLCYRLHTSEDSVPPVDAVCFACKYASSISDSKTISHEGVEQVINFMRDNLLKVEIIMLAKMTSKLFDHKVRDPANKNLQPGQEPIGCFHWRTIVDHLRCHTRDPQLRHMFDCWELQDMCKTIKEGMLYKKHKTKSTPDGRPLWTLDPAAHVMYMKTKRLSLQYQKSKPKDMAFFREGEHVQTGGSSRDAFFDRTGINAYRAFPETNAVEY